MKYNTLIKCEHFVTLSFSPYSLNDAVIISIIRYTTRFYRGQGSTMTTGNARRIPVLYVNSKTGNKHSIYAVKIRNLSHPFVPNTEPKGEMCTL